MDDGKTQNSGEEFSGPFPEVPGWDWDEGDYAWLSSKSGIHKDGVSIFFIHGGRIRHQAHIEHGFYDVEEFIDVVRKHAEGLENVRVVWDDPGDGGVDLWIEGTRLPNEEDLERLREARKRQARKDEMDLRSLQRRRPDLFGGTP